MKSKKQIEESLRKQLLELCGEIHDDDGVDPRLISNPENSNRKSDRKARQLCRQVQRTLEMVLSDCDDAIVHAMSIISVTQESDSSSLLVSVHFDARIMGNSLPNRSELMTRLANQTSRLRFEIARSINRKRVPNLTYSISLGADSLDNEANHDSKSGESQQESKQ